MNLYEVNIVHNTASFFWQPIIKGVSQCEFVHVGVCDDNMV